MPGISYCCHRFSPEIIQYALWLSAKFALNYRDIADLLAEPGLDISYETIGRWVNKFGNGYARRARSRRPNADIIWHLDEMVIVIKDKKYWLWRAVDCEGEVFEFLVQARRNKSAALRLFRKLLRKQKVRPEVIVTDKLCSYGAALRALNINIAH